MRDCLKKKQSAPCQKLPQKYLNYGGRIKSDQVHSPHSKFGFASATESQIQIIGQIAESRFPVFLIRSPSQSKNHVLKLYPFDHGNPHTSFLNECRFLSLQHQNLIPIYAKIDIDIFVSGDFIENASAIVMEYAPHGDFCDIVTLYPIYRDEVLFRTFFHHLIEGVKYLHSQKFCHLDLKLENLLLGKDMSLKLTDFDLSYKEGDTKIRCMGTKNYRAPEIRDRNCEDPIKADIYSMGIILYIFATKSFPYVEGYEDMMFEELSGSKMAFVDSKNLALDKENKSCIDLEKLILGMINPDPSKRFDIERVELNKWYCDKVYSNLEIWPALQRLGIDT